MTETASLKHDFPTWLPPPVVKELRQGMRTPAFTVVLAGLPVALSLLFLIGFMLDAGVNRLNAFELIDSFFWLLLSFCLLLIMPLRALSSIHREVDERTIDLLVLTRLSPRRIIRGKWCSHAVQTMLLVVTILPFLFVRYYYGGIDMAGSLMAVSGMVLFSLLLMSVALWVSGMHAFFRYLFLVALVLAGFFFVGNATIHLIFSISSSNAFESVSIWGMSLLAFNTMVITMAMIVLSSRWIAPPADNSSACLRLLALAPLLPVPVMALFGTHAIQDAIRVQFFFSLGFMSLIMILELTSPLKPLPVHFADLFRRPSAVFRQLFLTPGVFSASLFLALAAVMMGLGAALMAVAMPDVFAQLFPGRAGGSGIERVLAICWFLFLWVFSVHAPAIALRPLVGLLKFATPVVYPFVLIPVLILSAVFSARHMDFPLLFMPWGCLALPFSYFSIDGLNGSFYFYLVMSSLLLFIGIVCTSLFYASWAEARKKASQLVCLKGHD